MIYQDNIIYDDFFMMGERFTIEDYSDNSYALYHEGMFVKELASTDLSEAYAAAKNYMFACRY